MKKVGGGIATLIIVIAAAYFILGGGGGVRVQATIRPTNSSNNSSQNIIPPAPSNNNHTVYKMSPPGPNDNVRVWGAIAIAPSGGGGLSTKMSSKQATEHDAVEKCSQFNTGSELRVAFNNCAVYASAPDGTNGWATDVSIDTAREKAVTECHKYTSHICGSFIELYADGSVQRANVWVAVARSEDSALGWAHYPDMNQAVQATNKVCTAQSAKHCKPLTRLCANGNLRK
jgi:hypothetical protein